MQQIDAQGPVVVERISTQIADLACTPENARKLVEALHTGGSVTLEANGKTATFSPSVNLGYGEAFIALSLAAEALRNAGVTGCATPDQWQAVLMGGPLSAAGTTTTSTSHSATASSSSSFPGIIALRSQGQGWGQIAQTTHVQLGQVVSNAHSSFKLENKSDGALSPTGRSSSEFNRPESSSGRGSSSSSNPGVDHSTSRDHSPAGSSSSTTRHPDRDKSDKTDNDTDGKGKNDSDASSSSNASNANGSNPSRGGGR